MRKFENNEILARRALRIAELLKDHWEEESGFDTRFFQIPFIHDHLVFRGRSESGGGYREHIVPRVVIRDGCLQMIEDGAALGAVRDAIVQNLGIVEITPDEAYHLDVTLKLKTAMPIGWRFGIDDPLARIKFAGIKVVNDV